MSVRRLFHYKRPSLVQMRYAVDASKDREYDLSRSSYSSKISFSLLWPSLIFNSPFSIFKFPLAKAKFSGTQSPGATFHPLHYIYINFGAKKPPAPIPETWGRQVVFRCGESNCSGRNSADNEKTRMERFSNLFPAASKFLEEVQFLTPIISGWEKTAPARSLKFRGIGPLINSGREKLR